MSEDQKPQEKESSSTFDMHPIAQETENFVKNIDAIAETLPLLMGIMMAARKQAHEEYDSFLTKYGELMKEEGDGRQYFVAIEHRTELVRLRRRYESTVRGTRIVPRTLIVSLVSHYDFFLGRLLGHLFSIKPELLNAVDRQLSLSELSEFPSIEAAREYVIEKEIEGVMRRSHSDQFDWMENKFSIPLRKDLPIWPAFIEMTERRNLFAHTGGIVSSQYVSICASHDVKLPESINVGDQLDVNSDYFKMTCSCLIEISIKLAQVLWRKLEPTSNKAADRSLIESTYELLEIENYDLARTLLDFGVNTLKKHSNDEDRRILIINLAQSHKWLGQQDACIEVLNKEDWSACGDKFKLGVAVLMDDFNEAVLVMKRIGAEGEVVESDYKAWPLFQQFRRSKGFEKTFEEIFGKPFSTFETVGESTIDSA